MTDREKVIKGLETCYCPPSKCEDCPYYDLPDEQICNNALCLDALALLKEQEPIVPGLEQDANGIYSTCGNCKTRLWKLFGVEFEVNPDAMPKFCPQCGKAVKWNGGNDL